MNMKTILKKIVSITVTLFVIPFVVLSKIEEKLLRKEGLFVSMGLLLGMIPGKLGSYLRAAYYSATLEACNWEIAIGFGTVFTHRNSKVGKHASFGMNCMMGCVDIGEGVMLANRISIPSGKYQHLSQSGDIIKDTQLQRIKIGNNCWIGEGAIILSSIGDKSIVGAGSIVTKPMPSSVVVAGNPAAVLREI